MTAAIEECRESAPLAINAGHGGRTGTEAPGTVGIPIQRPRPSLIRQNSCAQYCNRCGDSETSSLGWSYSRVIGAVV